MSDVKASPGIPPDAWLTIPQAVRAAAESRVLSIGAAAAALCNACAGGTVRWRDEGGSPTDFMVPLGAAGGPGLTQEAWRRAHITDGEVIDGRFRYSVRINAADLWFWTQGQLRQGEAEPVTKDKAAPITTGAEQSKGPPGKTGPKTTKTKDVEDALFEKLRTEEVTVIDLENRHSGASIGTEYGVSETAALAARKSAIARFRAISK